MKIQPLRKSAPYLLLLLLGCVSCGRGLASSEGGPAASGGGLTPVSRGATVLSPGKALREAFLERIHAAKALAERYREQVERCKRLGVHADARNPELLSLLREREVALWAGIHVGRHDHERFSYNVRELEEELQAVERILGEAGHRPIPPDARPRPELGFELHPQASDARTAALNREIERLQSGVEKRCEDLYESFYKMNAIYYGQLEAQALKALRDEKINPIRWSELFRSTDGDPTIGVRDNAMWKELNAYFSRASLSDHYASVFAAEDDLETQRRRYWDAYGRGAVEEELIESYKRALIARDVWYIRTDDFPKRFVRDMGLGKLRGIHLFSREAFERFRRHLRWYVKQEEETDEDKLRMYFGWLEYARIRDRAEYLFHNPNTPLRSRDSKEFLRAFALATRVVDTERAANRLANDLLKLPNQPAVTGLIDKYRAELTDETMARYQYRGWPLNQAWRSFQNEVVLTSDTAFAIASIELVGPWSWTRADDHFSENLTQEQRRTAVRAAAPERAARLAKRRADEQERVRREDPRYLASAEAERRKEDRETIDGTWLQCRYSGPSFSRDVTRVNRIHREADPRYQAMYDRWATYVETGDRVALREAESHRLAVAEAVQQMIRVDPLSSRHRSRKAMLFWLETSLKYIPEAYKKTFGEEYREPTAALAPVERPTTRSRSRRGSREGRAQGA